MLNHTAASTITIIRTNKFSKSSINHSQWRRMKPKALLCSRMHAVRREVRRTLCTICIFVCDICKYVSRMSFVCVKLWSMMHSIRAAYVLSGSNYYFSPTKKQQKHSKNQIQFNSFPYSKLVEVKIISFHNCIRNWASVLWWCPIEINNPHVNWNTHV